MKFKYRITNFVNEFFSEINKMKNSWSLAIYELFREFGLAFDRSIRLQRSFQIN